MKQLIASTLVLLVASLTSSAFASGASGPGGTRRTKVVRETKTVGGVTTVTTTTTSSGGQTKPWCWTDDIKPVVKTTSDSRHWHWNDSRQDNRRKSTSDSRQDNRSTTTIDSRHDNRQDNRSTTTIDSRRYDTTTTTVDSRRYKYNAGGSRAISQVSLAALEALRQAGQARLDAAENRGRLYGVQAQQRETNRQIAADRVAATAAQQALSAKLDAALAAMRARPKSTACYNNYSYLNYQWRTSYSVPWYGGCVRNGFYYNRRYGF